MAKEERFVQIYTQGGGIIKNRMEIWVDRKTGVNYLYSDSGYGGGLTVLLDRDGKPVISTLPIEE